MAAKKKVFHEGKVSVTVPRARRGEPEDLFVSVNGVGYQIPKGKEVMVPQVVADEIERSTKAEDRMYEDKEQRLAASRA